MLQKRRRQEKQTAGKCLVLFFTRDDNADKKRGSDSPVADTNGIGIDSNAYASSSTPNVAQAAPEVNTEGMVSSAGGGMDSQIYNWGIKKGTTLDGGGPGGEPQRNRCLISSAIGSTLGR
ncbi:MAG: hypothetical protein RR211_07465, partial [Pseudoflavonifractor sp.]